MTAPTPQTKALQPIDELRGTLQKMSPEFAKALPSHIPAEKFVRVVMTAVQLDPKLLNADRKTLFSAAMRAAADGLLPDKREGVINVYGSEAVWMPMVAGLCKKARNSGEIATIDAQVVYQHDDYQAWTDEKGPHFKHVKARGDRGTPMLTYAYALTKDGGFYFEEVDETQMAAIEKSSKATSGPWKGPFKDEMRRKSALRRLAKYRLPSSTDLDQVLERDSDPIDVTPEPEQPAEPKTSSSRLKNIVEAQTVRAATSETQPTGKEPNEDPNVDDEVPI